VLSDLGTLVKIRLGAKNAGCKAIEKPIRALTSALERGNAGDIKWAKMLSGQLTQTHRDLDGVRDELVDGTEAHLVAGEVGAAALDLGQSVDEALTKNERWTAKRMRNAVDNLKASLAKLEMLCEE
jgi:hypothetical protein